MLSFHQAGLPSSSQFLAVGVEVQGSWVRSSLHKAQGRGPGPPWQPATLDFGIGSVLHLFLQSGSQTSRASQAPGCWVKAELHGPCSSNPSLWVEPRNLHFKPAKHLMGLGAENLFGGIWAPGRELRTVFPAKKVRGYHNLGPAAGALGLWGGILKVGMGKTGVRTVATTILGCPGPSPTLPGNM